MYQATYYLEILGIIIVILTLFLLARSLLVKAALPVQESIPSLSPITTIFAFDLHGVVLTINWRVLIKIIVLELPKGLFLRFLLNPFGFYCVLKLVKDGVLSERAFDNFCVKHEKFIRLKPFLIRFMVTQKFNQETMTILKTLKKDGYKLYILSNIWPSAFILLEKQYAIINQIFDGFYISAAENNYGFKPEPAFYQSFKGYLKNLEINCKCIVFIDNNSNNLEVAKTVGFYGLQVTALKQVLSNMKENSEI
jgi:hypothetical protein